MRFVISRLNHETNTFSPIPTTLESFRPLWGQDAYAAALGSQTAMGAFLAFAQTRGADVITPVFATANPSGPVSSNVYEALCAPIVSAAAAGCDAVLLDLHGAMVTEEIDDGEGELLARIRAVAPRIPIGVALDLHANVSARMVENSDIMVGFKTYPHVDMVETGEHVARLMGQVLDQGGTPAQIHRRLPMLAHTLMMNTQAPGAMRAAIAAAEAAERRRGVLAVSVFGGFPLADTPDTGVSVVVTADDAVTAERAAADVAGVIWAKRNELLYRECPLGESIALAKVTPAVYGRPVLLLDHGDNCMSGGTCDTMDVLVEALSQGLRDIVVGPICDPEAVRELVQAGDGSFVSSKIGNRMSLPGIGVKKRPIELSGVVSALSDGKYVISGPTYTGMECDMGPTAVLNTGLARVLITSLPHEPWDLGVFTCAGIFPTECRYLILKSRMYCRPVFEPLSAVTIECASLGVTSSDYSLFDFKKISRPIYPLELPSFNNGSSD